MSFFLKNALKANSNFSVIEGITLETAQDMSAKIPYIVMGEVKLFANVYEIEFGVALSASGQKVYSKRIVAESEEDIKTQFATMVEDIYQEIKKSQTSF